MKNKMKVLLGVGIVSLVCAIASNIDSLEKFKENKMYSERDVIELKDENKKKEQEITREQAIHMAIEYIELLTGDKIVREKVSEVISLNEHDGFTWSIEFDNKKDLVYFVDISASNGKIRNFNKVKYTEYKTSNPIEVEGEKRKNLIKSIEPELKKLTEVSGFEFNYEKDIKNISTENHSSDIEVYIERDETIGFIQVNTDKQIEELAVYKKGYIDKNTTIVFEKEKTFSENISSGR